MSRSGKNIAVNNLIASLIKHMIKAFKKGENIPYKIYYLDTK